MPLASWTLPLTTCGGCRAVAELLWPHALCLTAVWKCSFGGCPFVDHLSGGFQEVVLVKYQIWCCQLGFCKLARPLGMWVWTWLVLQLSQPHCTPVHVSLNHLWSSLQSARQFVQTLWYKMCAFIWAVFSSSFSLFLLWLDKNCVCF